MYTKQALILIVYVDAFTIEWVRARSCIPRISLGDSSFLSRYLISRVHDRWQRCIIREDIISYCCVLFICGTMKRPWKSLGSRRACSSKDLALLEGDLGNNCCNNKVCEQNLFRWVTRYTFQRIVSPYNSRILGGPKVSRAWALEYRRDAHTVSGTQSAWMMLIFNRSGKRISMQIELFARSKLLWKINWTLICI